MNRVGRFCLAPALVILLLIITACSTSRSDGPSTTTLKVRVWTDWTYVQDAAKQFEAAHPGVRVQIDGISSGDYFQTLEATLASTSAPDVTSLQVIPGTYSSLVKHGLLADLSDIWQSQNLEQHYRAPTTKRYTTADGRRYAVSTALQWTPIVYYNQTAFEKAGIQPPDGRRIDMAKWYEMVKKLSNGGYVPLATYGISDEYGAAFILASMLRSSCGEVAYNNFLINWMGASQESAHWTDRCAMAAIQLIADWGAEGIFGKAPAAQSNAASLALFQSGRAAMYESGSWETKALPTLNLPFKYDWLLLPTMANGVPNDIMLADHDGLGVNAHSQHLELARELVALVSSEDFQRTATYFNTAGVPPRGDLKPPPGFDSMKSEQLKAIDAYGSSTQLTVAVPYNHEIGPLLARMLAGELSSEQVARMLQGMVQSARTSN